MLFVVIFLYFTTTNGFIDGFCHGFGLSLSVHNYPSIGVSSGSSDHLQEGVSRSEEALFVGVKDADQRYFRQVESFSKKINSHNDFNFSLTEFGEKLDSFDRFDLGVKIFGFYAGFDEVFSEVFG